MAVAANLMHACAGGAAQSSSRAQAPMPSVGTTMPDLQLGVLFERVLEAVVVARLATGEIVLWNSAAQKLFGYSAQEVVGKSVEILMPEAIAQVHRAGLFRYLRTGHGLIIDAQGPVEMPARTSLGEEIRIELTLSELSDVSGERYAVATMRDATQRKQLELLALELVQARVARSEVEAELADRDELLHAVTALLQHDPSPDELQRLSRTLAEFRRLHSGELAVRNIETDLVDIVHAAADYARRNAAGRRLLVHTPPMAAVSCDPARMRQVLDQVLDETIRRTRDGARIELRLEVVSSHLVQLTIRSDAGGDPRPAGPGLQLSRTLVQRQGGTFTTAISSGGSLEVVVTLPGSPHPPRRRQSRRNRPTRPAARS